MKKASSLPRRDREIIRFRSRGKRMEKQKQKVRSRATYLIGVAFLRKEKN